MTKSGLRFSYANLRVSKSGVGRVGLSRVLSQTAGPAVEAGVAFDGRFAVISIDKADGCNKTELDPVKRCYTRLSDTAKTLDGQ